jgi:hypothetical protein
MNLLITFGNPITGTSTTCVWGAEAMRKVGKGARELQELCDQKDIRWRVVDREDKIIGIFSPGELS